MATVVRGGRWASSPARPPPPPVVPAAATAAAGGDDSDVEPGGSAAIIALVLQRTQIGVAVYKEAESELLWSQCVFEVTADDDYRVVRKVMAQVNPAVIVLHAPLKSNKPFLRAVHSDSPSSPAPGPPSGPREPDSPGSAPGSPTVHFLAGTEFSNAKASQHMSLISLLAMPPHLSPRDKLAYLSHIVDPECETAFRAVGGLLGFLLREGVVNSLERPDEPICFSGMRQENFAAAMHVSRGTQRALQVFQLDAHPLGHGCGAAKEGLSLYGILCRTRSVAGGRLMRAWVASPSTELGVIEERQAVVALLRSPAQDAAFAALVDSLRGVKNVPAILRRLQTVTAGVTDWEGLEKSARALLSVHDALRALHAGEPELGSTSLYRRFLEVDAAALRDAVKWISSVLDFPESKAAGRLVVADGFSEDIDAMRECYAGLDEFLTRVGVQEMNRITDSTPLRIPRLQLVYLPQVGYLILLDHHFLATPAASDGMLSAGGLEFMFSSPEHGGYFKNERCCVLDAEVGDIHGALIDLEAKAVRYLETKVLPSASAIYQASGVAAELDCLAAFAAAANEYNWVRPVFDPHGHGLHIEHGRHALQELIIPSFIPNSMAARGGDVHVVTGPNCSGKSVFCKQVALIAILAHVGSCVPAQSCRLGIIDTIYTRIASHESVSLNQSSFFIDASQVAGMLRGADERSLVLLDEWGKGTNETDGMALFAATLSELLRRPADRAPICLAATHFTELLADPFLPMSSTRLGVFSMDVLVEAAGHGANRLDDRTVYLYRVVPGSLRGESRAIHCAQTAGVPREVLMRSIEVRSAVQRNAPLEAAPESTRLARITAAVRAFLEADLGSDTFDVRDFLSTLPL